MRATAIVANLPRLIAERESKVIKRELDLDSSDLEIEEIRTPAPGNIVLADVQSDNLTEVFASFGAKEIRSETVASVSLRTLSALDRGRPRGRNLADHCFCPWRLVSAVPSSPSPSRRIP